MNDLEIALLDYFPVQQSELLHLLNVCNCYEVICSQHDKTYSLLTKRDAQNGSLCDTTGLVRKLVFKKLIESALNLPYIYSYPNYDSEIESLRHVLLEAFVSLLGRRGENRILEIMFQSCLRKGDLDMADPKALIILVFQLARYTVTQETDEVIISSDELSKWTDFISYRTQLVDSISLVEWKRWSTTLAPNVYRVVATTFHHLLLGIDFVAKPSPGFEIPFFDGEDTTFLSHKKGSSSMLMQLGLTDLGGRAYTLYSNDRDGLSFSIFENAIQKFSGPTLILIETVVGDIIGYFSEIPWKSTSDWYTGDGESFLFRLHPSWNVYYPNENGLPKKNHQFLHNPMVKRKGQLAGLTVGGISSDTPRLHITTSLEKCEASSAGLTFESGPLLSDDENFFDIDTLEVWAMRTPDIEMFKLRLAEGQRRLSIGQAVKARCAQVDRSQFVDDFTSGAVMNHLFDHRQDTRGRADLVKGDSRRSGYYVEGKCPSPQHISESVTEL